MENGVILKKFNENIQKYAADFSSGDLWEKLKKYAAKLKSVPCIGEGKGEILKELHTGLGKIFEAVVVIPDFPISTAEAYRGCIPDESRPALHTLFGTDYRNWKNGLTNDFEKSLFPLYPFLEEIKQELYAHGAFYASLSGSGSAVFGLFERAGADKESYGFSERCLIRRSRIAIV